MTLAAPSRAPTIADTQLDKLMHELRIRAGITIDSTPGVVAGYVQQRMECLDVPDVAAYLGLFDDSISARAEWLALTDLLTVKETRFFRQVEAFACLEHYLEEWLDEAPATGEFSFWSAGCSTGQELYSMAMVVESVISSGSPWLEWHGIGSDLSFRAIVRSREAVYPEKAMQDIPEQYSGRYMDPKLGERWKVTEDIRSRTNFFHSNLLHVDSTPFADFNVVFCQNVLIYFSREMQHWIIDQLVDRVRPGGLLVLGAGEDASWTNSHVERLQWPGVCAYKKTGG